MDDTTVDILLQTNNGQDSYIFCHDHRSKKSKRIYKAEKSNEL